VSFRLQAVTDLHDIVTKINIQGNAMALIGKAVRRTDGIVARVAEKVGCEPAVIDAIIHTETNEIAFDPSGRLVIRPEAAKLAVCPLLSVADKAKAAKLGLTKQPKLIGYEYDPIKAGNSAWSWVDRVAHEFGEEAAYWSTSFGSPQIMGFNFTMCKFASPIAMVRAFADEEDAQLMAMGDFLISSGLKDACRNRNWKAIARLYNGPAYAKNAYDQKLEQFYNESSHLTPTAVFTYPQDDVLEFGEHGDDVKALQVQLQGLGFHVNADGDFGTETRDAVRAVQFRLGLTADGKVGPETRKLMAAAPPKEPPATPAVQVIAASSTAKASLAQIATGVAATGVAAANALTSGPATISPPSITDVEGAVRLSEQGIGLGQKILAIGVDKLLLALGIGAIIFGAIALTRRLQAHYQRKIG
jgi:peptidoglycan hydrolase-like protein with peptidoglycan-binding domain